MAFRHGFGFGRKRPLPSPTVVYDVQQKVTVDEKGVQRVSFVEVPNDELCKGIPTPSEYSLENLLRAGVPLEQVSCNILDTAPTDAQLNKIVDSLSGSDEPNTNDVVEPTNE